MPHISNFCKYGAMLCAIKMVLTFKKSISPRAETLLFQRTVANVATVTF